MNLGAPELGIFFIAVAFAIVPIVLGIWTAIDASRLPDFAFERAGTSKTLWIVLPIVGMFLCGIVTIVAAIMWFTSYKPRVVEAAAAGGTPSA
jgi:membrane protease YdiL (CAAX protease family)